MLTFLQNNIDQTGFELKNFKMRHILLCSTFIFVCVIPSSSSIQFRQNEGNYNSEAISQQLQVNNLIQVEEKITVLLSLTCHDQIESCTTHRRRTLSFHCNIWSLYKLVAMLEMRAVLKSIQIIQFEKCCDVNNFVH